MALPYPVTYRSIFVRYLVISKQQKTILQYTKYKKANCRVVVQKVGD